MEQYQIEEIVFQDKYGCLLHAKDLQHERNVSLYRFFPHGKNNGGLNPEESKAFRDAFRFMANITHPVLRKVYDAGVDTLDHLPYVAGEWVDGTNLQDFLEEDGLEPSSAINLLRIYIDASIHVSKKIGHDSIWLDTELSSIIMSSKDTERPITFRLTPTKWFNSNRAQNTSIVLSDFLRKLMHWEDRKISDQEGEGLGAWLCWLRMNSECNLTESLESLNALTRNTNAASPTWSKPKISNSAIVRSVRKESHATRNVLLFGAVPLVIVCVVLFIIQKNKSPQASASASTPNKHTSTSNEIAVSQTTREEMERRAIQYKEELEKSNAVANDKLTEIKSNAEEREGIFLPEDLPYARTLEHGTSFKLRGKVATVSPSSTGKTIYLYFSSPINREELAGAINKADVERHFKNVDLKGFIGKTILIDGVVSKQVLPKDSVVIKVYRPKQITVE